MRDLRPALTAALALVIVTVRPDCAAAQTAPRVWIGVNGGYQATTTEFDDTFTFTVNQETGTTRVSYPVDAGFLFDAGGGVRLWKNLGVGVAISRFVLDGTAQTSSSIPHPLFLQQNRQVDGEADGLTREETGIHVQAQYRLPLTGRLQIVLAGGPSLLQVNQMVVTDVNYSEDYPYDTATFRSVDSERSKGSATGLHAGVDAQWAFTRSVGLGALVRFTRATVDLDGPADRTISVDAGGAHIAAGLRLTF